MSKHLLKWAALLIAAISLGSCGGGGGGDSASTSSSNSGSTAQAGSYELYVPANFKPNESALVIALHPLLTNGPFMRNLTGLNAKADQVGFAVAYPSASGSLNVNGTWNWFFRDDTHVTYLRSLINSLQTSLKPDPKKIYVTGYSDGAIMTHRVGVQLSDLVAAIGVVEGSLYETGITQPVQPVPPAVAPISVLMLMGDLDLDQNVGYCGRPNVFPTQDVVFNYWTSPSGNDCSTVDTAAPLCIGSAVSDVAMKHATGCKSGVTVDFYRVYNATHEWFNVSGNWSQPLNVPSTTRAMPYNPNFNISTGITTNDILWNYFSSHPKP